MTVEDFCLLTRSLNQLSGTTPAAAGNGSPRMSSRAEIRSFFGLPQGGTGIVVDKAGT